MTTLEDDLIAMGEDPSGQFPCACCQREFPAFALAFRNEEASADSATCADCEIDVQRVATAQAEMTERELLEATDPWATDLGAALKVERNRRIDAARWAIDPATSPLSPACQAAWIAYTCTLHRITLDFTGPTHVEWPDEPALEYANPS